jgi:hypothetical protein
MYETETKIVLIYILELEPEVLHTSKEPNRVKNLMRREAMSEANFSAQVVMEGLIKRSKVSRSFIGI